MSEADLRETDLNGANLRCADLRETDLNGADLRGANLSGAKLPVNTWIIYGEPYYIFIHGDNIQAGCERHNKSEWANFSLDEIERMCGQEALDFYPRLLEIIDFYCGDKK